MIKAICFVLFFILSKSSIAGQIALTFDDAPRGDEKIFSGNERTSKIITTLKKYKIETVFFVNTSKLTLANGANRIRAYSEAGHKIANHTHSHMKLKDTSTEKFIEHINNADILLRQFITYTKWFRFPFLGEGPTIQIRDQVRNHLKEKDYINGYVTVDNYDYFINELVQEALGKGNKVNFDRACNMLVDLMWDGIDYYEGVAQKYIGNVRHVLLMHENDIEAFCLERLITHIQKKGWQIISPENAFNDPLMKKEPETLYLNQGRVAAYAHVKSRIESRSKWESVKSLTKEFEKRQIVEE